MSAFITRRGGSGGGSGVDVISGTLTVPEAVRAEGGTNQYNTYYTYTIPELIGKTFFMIGTMLTATSATTISASNTSSTYSVIFLVHYDANVHASNVRGIYRKNGTVSSGYIADATFDPETGVIRVKAVYASSSSSTLRSGWQFSGDLPYIAY